MIGPVANAYGLTSDKATNRRGRAGCGGQRGSRHWQIWTGVLHNRARITGPLVDRETRLRPSSPV
ncbi:hypothetical protein [Micromonospora rubida]